MRSAFQAGRAPFILAMVGLAAAIALIPDLLGPDLLGPDPQGLRATPDSVQRDSVPSSGQATEATDEATEKMAKGSGRLGRVVSSPLRDELERPLASNEGSGGPQIAAVSGRVVDGLGHPVRGCLVVLAELLDQPGFDPDRATGISARTDGDGRFRLPHAGGRSLRLMLRHEDFPTTDAAVGLNLIPDKSIELGDLVLRTRPGLVVRTVSAESGLPLQGARVELEPLLEDAFLPDALRALRRRTASSGPEGVATFYGLGEGRYRLLVTAEDRAAVELPHTHPATRPSERPSERIVSLPPGATLRGRVVDPERLPIPGALVRAELLTGGAPVPPVRTDPGGGFLISNLQQLPHRLIVESRTHGLLIREPVVVDGGDAAVEIEMPAGLSIQGLVLSDGVAVPDARVEAVPSGDWPLVVDGQVFRPGARTDDRGSFAIRGLPAGRFLLLVESNGFVPSDPLAVEAGGAPITLNLKPPCQVTGKVLDPGGRPLNGAQIEVLRSDDDGTDFSTLMDRVVHGRQVLPRTESGRGGRFLLDGVPPGNFLLRIRADGQAPHATDAFAVPAGGVVSLPAIQLPRGALVSGRAMGADGSAVKGAVVVADPRSDNRPGTPGAEASTAADGTYSIGPLAAGSYELFYYYPAGQTAAEAAESRRLTMVQVQVQPGARLVQNLIHR